MSAHTKISCIICRDRKPLVRFQIGRRPHKFILVHGKEGEIFPTIRKAKNAVKKSDDAVHFYRTCLLSEYPPLKALLIDDPCVIIPIE